MELIVVSVLGLAALGATAAMAWQPARPMVLIAFAAVVVGTGAVLALAFADQPLVGSLVALIGVFVGAAGVRRDASSASPTSGSRSRE